MTQNALCIYARPVTTCTSLIELVAKLIMSSSSTYAVLAVVASLLIAQAPEVASVVVDGTKDGPSAKANQSSEEVSIDNFNMPDCGIYDQQKTETVFVNSAREGEFPWAVSMQVMRDDGSHGHFCMGAFINERWILSAAHCWADPHLKPFLNKNKVIISAGSPDAHGEENINFDIERIFYHSKFERKSPIGFDVSLIQVKQTAPLSTKYKPGKPFINTICLPIEGRTYSPGEAVKLAGWGDSESKDPKSKPERMLTTDLLLVDGEKCASIFTHKLKKVKSQFEHYRDFICADYHGERDACQGDSGGSLMQYADNKAVSIGIVSYGLGCATKGVPGVYEKTAALMPWIKDIVKNAEEASVKFVLLKPNSDSKE